MTSIIFIGMDVHTSSFTYNSGMPLSVRLKAAEEKSTQHKPAQEVISVAPASVLSHCVENTSLFAGT